MVRALKRIWRSLTSQFTLIKGLNGLQLLSSIGLLTYFGVILFEKNTPTRMYAVCIVLNGINLGIMGINNILQQVPIDAWNAFFGGGIGIVCDLLFWVVEKLIENEGKKNLKQGLLDMCHNKKIIQIDRSNLTEKESFLHPIFACLPREVFTNSTMDFNNYNNTGVNLTKFIHHPYDHIYSDFSTLISGANCTVGPKELGERFLNSTKELCLTMDPTDKIRELFPAQTNIIRNRLYFDLWSSKISVTPFQCAKTTLCFLALFLVCYFLTRDHKRGLAKSEILQRYSSPLVSTVCPMLNVLFYNELQCCIAQYILVCVGDPHFIAFIIMAVNPVYRILIRRPAQLHGNDEELGHEENANEPGIRLENLDLNPMPEEELAQPAQQRGNDEELDYEENWNEPGIRLENLDLNPMPEEELAQPAQQRGNDEELDYEENWNEPGIRLENLDLNPNAGRRARTTSIRRQRRTQTNRRRTKSQN
ncbi:hypothetical protein WICPIJ_003520 [Wickerhamomyces pijperi]|uniref:Uncharacterized protein n=1 Tax=Wickerhamomyces pijperi TaxID=599730 RepID=A0A9P8TMX8_WICPI|nr:hypothetical protein WICPIJ_003520 [Wickerhamomyces pijperi]